MENNYCQWTFFISEFAFQSPLISPQGTRLPTWPTCKADPAQNEYVQRGEIGFQGHFFSFQCSAVLLPSFFSAVFFNIIFLCITTWMIWEDIFYDFWEKEGWVISICIMCHFHFQCFMIIYSNTGKVQDVENNIRWSIWMSGGHWSSCQPILVTPGNTGTPESRWERINRQKGSSMPDSRWLWVIDCFAWM